MKSGALLGSLAVICILAQSAGADDLLGRSRNRDTGGNSAREQVRSGDRSSNDGALLQGRGRADDRVRNSPPIRDRARDDGARRGDIPPTEDRGRNSPPIRERARDEGARRGDIPPTEDRGRNSPPIRERARDEGAIRREGETVGRDRDNVPPRVIVGPYGVIDPSSRAANGGNPVSRTRDGGSRTVYGTVTNARANVVDIRDLPPSTYRRAPIDLLRGPLAHQALRETVELRSETLRIGYVHYDSRWRDDDFFYAYYEFRPHFGRCALSPWYYYPHLPGYIRAGRVVIVEPLIAIYASSDRYYPWRSAPTYGWIRPVWLSDRYRFSDVDWAIDDLVSVFERRDRRALERLVPRNGRVGVWIDERFAYTLSPDDFFDLLLDNAFGTRTRRYDILEVRRWRDQVRVLARHDYVDPWGRLDSVYHTYRLEPEGRGYVIVDFGSSAFRPRL